MADPLLAQSAAGRSPAPATNSSSKATPIDADNAAVLDCNDLALELGLHAEILADIAASAASNPLDERLAGQLILALYRCGRQAAAFEHYQRVRLHLVEELGTDPGASLQRMHQRMLTADPALPRLRGRRLVGFVGCGMVGEPLEGLFHGGGLLRSSSLPELAAAVDHDEFDADGGFAEAASAAAQLNWYGQPDALLGFGGGHCRDSDSS